MRVSIVIPTHSNYHDCVDAVASILTQRYGNIEILIIIDNNPSLYKKLTKIFQRFNSKVRFILTSKPTTLSESRNIGVSEATGDIIVFTDDDIIADQNWIKNIVKVYKKYNAVGVSGDVIPLWEDDTYRKIPKVLWWLVGCTYDGFCDRDICKVRNGIGPNFSFKREVFQEVGYFNENLGFANNGKKMLQGEEAEFSIRVIKRFGNRIIHTKHAKVYHKVPKRKTGLWYLLKRSFWQGYSKAVIERKLGSDATKTEQKYLTVIKRHISARPSMKSLLVLTMTLAVALGYITGELRSSPKRREIR